MRCRLTSNGAQSVNGQREVLRNRAAKTHHSRRARSSGARSPPFGQGGPMRPTRISALLVAVLAAAVAAVPAMPRGR
jgi:hypothetical protein